MITTFKNSESSGYSLKKGSSKGLHFKGLVERYGLRDVNELEESFSEEPFVVEESQTTLILLMVYIHIG